MSIQIPIDHTILLLKDKVQQISQEFLDDWGFNYFQYLRVFSDGSIGLLTNHTGLVEYFPQMGNAPLVFSSFQEQHKNAHSYWFLWDEELPIDPVKLAREKFNIRHGITYVRRFQHYYDMIAVAVPHEHPNPALFYLNKLKAIEHFIHDFDRNHKDLIGLMVNNVISLPSPNRDVNFDKMCLTSQRITIHGRYGPSYITAQELACLRLLTLNHTYKEIGSILQISPRSVETYIARIKERTGFSSSHALARILMMCP